MDQLDLQLLVDPLHLEGRLDLAIPLNLSHQCHLLYLEDPVALQDPLLQLSLVGQLAQQHPVTLVVLWNQHLLLLLFHLVFLEYLVVLVGLPPL